MTDDERKQLIAQYRDGYRAVSEALLKITPEELDARPGPGRWSPREIIHHLADSELSAGMKKQICGGPGRLGSHRRIQQRTVE